MDLQNCLNLQRELLYLPPSYPVANVTEMLPTQRNLHAGRKKKKKSPNKENKSKINHTDKNKTSINSIYCKMPFSWLEEKFKPFCFSLNKQIIKLILLGECGSAHHTAPAPVFHIRHRTK